VCVRVDALGEVDNAEVGIENRTHIETRLRFLESHMGQELHKNFKKDKPKAFTKHAAAPSYNTESDMVIPKLNQTFVSSKKKDVKEDEEEPKKKKVKA